MAVVKNKRTREEKEYWAYVESTAAEVRKWPKWMGGDAEEEHHDHEADVDDSKPLPPNEGLNPSGPKYF